MDRISNSLTPARFEVERVAGDKELTDDQVLEILRTQMRRNLAGGTLKISVRATEEQVDKAMLELMAGIAKREIEQIEKASGLR